MHANFIQIDTVFGLDCPICALNMKRMWCEYTCNPNKADFVIGKGYLNDSDPLVVNATDVLFTVHPDYACIIFKSCEKVSIVAQASLQSSIAFLDFMGFNGKQQTHSLIEFNFSTNLSVALNSTAFSCDTLIPISGNFSNYTKVGNCSCASCDSACPPPPVDAFIGFFDGFNGILVAIVYAALIAFSAVFQLIKRKLNSRSRGESEVTYYDEPEND